MTVHVCINGVLREMELPTKAVGNPACVRDKPECPTVMEHQVSRYVRCDECPFYRMPRIGEDAAWSKVLDMEETARRRAYSAELRREKVNLQRDDLELWGRDKWAWMARRKADSGAWVADGRG